ncbi:MaoC/PaaZ C-terminal domain-containing protein [Pseudonocardia kunmingensis]|uniref:Acyl dehydratase n=1 Tax=Pseudonocardia kunmingensis TaxID=630975 RepID=A0A543DJE0_9PSEU|nr:MaoC/PaaZ C-terminal domain-containing protein [Pseudonocardia kunmingensis]TQM09448.1 acyl dehydratase [Pseudonocardia kunmingensis]
MTDRYFEDFAVGQRFTSGTRTVTAADLADFTRLSGDDHPIHTEPGYRGGGAPVLQGPFGPAVAMGLLQGLGLAGDAVLGLLDTHWHYRRPVHVGDVLRLEMTVVRCRRTRRGDRGVVTRHMRLVDDDGAVVQEGTTAVLLAARGVGPDPVARDFGTVAWGEALTGRLGPAFAEALPGWDGTIGLRAGDHEVHLRIYRGTVIEVSGRSALGATFTLEADELTWTELVESERNDFVRRAMAGAFAVRGNGYEYLRLTRPLSLLVDAARALARAGEEAAA